MKKLLVAYDGSEASTKAIDVAIQCSTHDDELVLLTVIPAALVESTFTNMLLPTIDLSTVVTPGTFKEKAMENLGKIAKQLEGTNKAFLDRFSEITKGIPSKITLTGQHQLAVNITGLGGLDIELMTHGSVQQVKARTRQILEACAPGGGYCMGTGNSVANYVKIENYYAMLDETRKWNEEHGY